MSEQERHATAEQLWSQLSDSKGFTVLPRESVVLNELIRQRGIAPVVNLLKPENPDAIWRLWLDHAALSAVIARGEVTKLWDATPEKGRGFVLSNVGQRLNQRQVVKSLASKHSVLGLADWLDSLSDRELQGLSPFQREPLAGCFYRVGLGQRYADFTNRSMASQRERFGSRVPHRQATDAIAQLTPDPVEASDLRRESLVWLATQRADRGDAADLLNQVEVMQYAAMSDSLAQSEFDSLVRHWKQLRVANSNQAEAMKSFIPRVDKAGNRKLADELFSVTLQFLESRIGKFEKSIELRLARAELCIACRRQLELARSDLKGAETIAGVELDSVRVLRERLDH